MKTQQQIEVDQNYDAFQHMLGAWLPEHRGQYALMESRQLVAFFDRPGDAFRAGKSRFGEDAFSIQEVTDEPIDLGLWSHVAH